MNAINYLFGAGGANVIRLRDTKYFQKIIDFF